MLTALLLAVACLGYYTVIYLPRQAQREAAARMLAEKTRTEKDQADLRSFAAILATVDALARGAPEAQEQATAAAVRDYLAKAAEPYRTDVAGAWEKRRSAWEDFTSAHRTGSLVVETDPPGATVTLLPNGETKKSPAAFNDLKPGKVTLRVELEGYEPQVVPFAIKPGFAGKIDPVRLTAIFGSIAFTSEPNDLPVVVVGNGRTLKGRTPFDAAKLPPGTYRANFAREGWRPQEKSVTITGGARAAVFADLKGFSLHLESTPAGAQILLDQRAVGVAPLTLTGLEPRDYQVVATLEGYINYGQITRLTANASLTLTLQPKPVTRLLQKLAGHTWRMDANWGFAELHFDLQGLIHGTHMVRTAGAAVDQGRVDSGNAINNVLLAKFAPAQAPPFYSGEVRIRIIDDNSLGVSWQLNRTVISYTFRRRD